MFGIRAKLRNGAVSLKEEGVGGFCLIAHELGETHLQWSKQQAAQDRLVDPDPFASALLAQVMATRKTLQLPSSAISF